MTANRTTQLLALLGCYHPCGMIVHPRFMHVEKVHYPLSFASNTQAWEQWQKALFKNACIHVCVHAQYPSSIFFCHSPPYFSRQSLSLNLEFTNLTKLVGQQSPGIHLSHPPALRWALLTTGVLTWVLDEGTQLSLLMEQAIYLLSHLPNLAISIYWNISCVRGSTIVSCHSKWFTPTISFNHREDCQ